MCEKLHQMISNRIHVAYPELIGLDDVDFSSLKESFEAAADGATAIDILGGYYSAERTLSLIKRVPRTQRAGCRIRIAVGLDAAIKIRQCWDDMRYLDTSLKKAGFKDVSIYIVSGPRHFHTKLFHFLRRTHHLWFVGSANPGSDRHELMVSLSGKHEALSGYVEAVFASAQPVTAGPRPNKLPTSLREFFLTGSLIHKKPQQAPFTFDAFRLAPEDRDKMMRSLTATSLPHARPTTQGFSFSLRSAVGSSEFAEEKNDEVSRIQLRRYTVDTLLGSWAPRRYGNELHTQLRESEATKADDLRRFSLKIVGRGEGAVRAAFADYVGAMESFLLNLGIPVRSVEDREGAFNKFLKSRQNMLGDDANIERLSQRLQIVDMPDIWYDEKAARAFETSFFDDIENRLSINSNSKILRCLLKGLGEVSANYPTTEQLKGSLEKRLRRQSWKDTEWDNDD